MLRMTPIADAKRAATYFGKSDGGYYLDGDNLRREWGGRGAAMLGLSGTPEFEQFTQLIEGRDPHSGKQLTAKLIEVRIPGWDFTASVPKGVTTALECGDDRIREALWEAGREVMAEVERHAATRVRKGGRHEDRSTGNLVWLGVEHFETRPTEADGMPDWDRHLHFVVLNVAKDEAEGAWKAVKMRPVFDLKKYFSHQFDLRMSAKLAALGYEIETKLRPDERGGRKFYSWDIKGIPDSVVAKNSRRSGEIERLEAEIVAERQARDPGAPDRLSAVARDKLGGTSRNAKRKDRTLAECRDYWQARITPEERRAIDETIGRAVHAENPPLERTAAKAMEYAIAHHFQRSSVVAFTELAVTAMERSMGGALPEELEREAIRQGVLFCGGQATTRAVLEQEQRIIGFARGGKGVFAPLAPGDDAGLAHLSAEQKAAVLHVWNSSDQLLLIRGGAGTGKTTMMTPALASLGVPVALLAPSADASRTTLRKEGFAAADTVAAFLDRREMQDPLRGGGIIWVDEAGLLTVNDLDRLCAVASKLDARLVLQGDPNQHKSVDRHGNMLNVLEEYAALPVAKLTAIQRQKGGYAAAVAAIRDGELEKGDAMLRRLGWVVEGEGHDALVAEYARAIDEHKASGERKTVLVIDPTHRDGDALTERLRVVRRDKGLIRGEERSVARLVALGWTDAQKADASRYSGEEVIQFYRNSGKFKAGDRVQARNVTPQLAVLKPGSFAVFRETEARFAVGDTVRITGNGWDASRTHRIDNGRIDRIDGFTAAGDLVLSNGWIVGKSFGHLAHGLVQTSPATQSKTDDIVLAAMNRQSLGAMSAEQGYVTISRGRERGMIFTDLPRAELVAAISRGDRRRSATELLERPSPAPPAAVAESRMRQFMEKVRQAYRQLQRLAAEAVRQPLRERSMGYGR